MLSLTYPCRQTGGEPVRLLSSLRGRGPSGDPSAARGGPEDWCPGILASRTPGRNGADAIRADTGTLRQRE